MIKSAIDIHKYSPSWNSPTSHASHHSRLSQSTGLSSSKFPLVMWGRLGIMEKARKHIHSVQFSHSVMCDSLWPHGLQHIRLPYPSPTPRAYSSSFRLSQWCHPSIAPSVVPFSSCLWSFPALGSFQMSQFFTSGGHSIGVSVSASVLPMNIQDWSPLGWTGLISLQSKELSRVFSNTTVQKHQFFSAQLSL